MAVDVSVHPQTGAVTIRPAFVDGNNRVSAMAAELFLSANDFALDANDAAIVRMVLDAARGRLAVEAISIWFSQRVRVIER